jgi:type IV pilus assembly protein PilF
MLICFLSSVSGCSWFTDQEDGPSKEAAANTYAKLGTEYLRMGQMNVALEKLRLALELDDNNIEAHDSIAVLYEQIKEYPKAQQHFEAALSLQPERAATLNNYGRFLCDRGEYEEAFEHLQKAMAMPLNDNKWYAFTNAGRCELMRGDQNKAEQYFRQALEYQANYAPALLELQRISYRNGNYLSAKAFLQRYLEVAEHTPGTLWVGIQTELALGNRELAFQYRRLLLEKFANSNEAKQIQATLPSSSTNPSNN